MTTHHPNRIPNGRTDSSSDIDVSHALTALPGVVGTVISAIVAHDRQAFLDAFAPDGVVDDWGTLYRGRDEITVWNDRELIGADGVLDVQRAVTAPSGEATVVGDWRSSFANEPSAFTFATVGEQVTHMTIREG
jgi:hypothetical protein